MKAYNFDLLAYPTIPSEAPGTPIPSTFFDPAVGARNYREHPNEMVYCEDLGFEGVVFNEHHYSAYGTMPSPNLIAAAHVPASVDEMAEAGLEAAPCELVKPPRVKASPIALECLYLQTVTLPSARDGRPNYMVVGQVIGIHVADDVITDGLIDVHKIQPLARLGYLDYATLGDVFAMTRPD